MPPILQMQLKEQIRKMYAQSIGENTVHGSDSAENAAIKVNWFFKGNEVYNAFVITFGKQEKTKEKATERLFFFLFYLQGLTGKTSALPLKSEKSISKNEAARLIACLPFLFLFQKQAFGGKSATSALTCFSWFCLV